MLQVLQEKQSLATVNQEGANVHVFSKQLYQMLIDFQQRNTAVINTSSAHQHNLNAKKSAIVHNESKRWQLFQKVV